MRGLLLAVALAGAGCAGPGDEPSMWLVVDTEPRLRAGLRDISFEPAVSPTRRILSRDGAMALSLPLEGLPRSLRVTAPGTCPVDVDLSTVSVGASVRASLRPWIETEPAIAQAGFDAPVRIEVSPGCREVIAGTIRWRVVEGEDLLQRQPSRQGFVLEGRTRPRVASLPDPLPWGIVPISPRTRDTTVLEGRWEGRAAAPVTLTVRVSAAARATGLPSVPLGQRVLLGGDGWTVVAKPPRATARVHVNGGVPTLEPDARGRWTLRDAAGAELELRVGRYDETPLDCGRPECHAAATSNAVSTRMTNVLSRALRGQIEGWAPACAIGCHVVGEAGLPDGGFVHVARELDASLPTVASEQGWDQLPAALRRLGGVGCIACHGPGAIPAPESRRAVLRADVCAVCHDAPPRYGQVDAWRQTRMAQSDVDEEARTSAQCRPCHTTAGFLAAVGIRPEPTVPPVGETPTPPGPPPATVAGSTPGELTSPTSLRPDPPAGIACAACHAPHGEHVGLALLRALPVPEALRGAGAEPHGGSHVCLFCHAPRNGEPVASAAAIWLGRGGVVPGNGAPLVGPPDHVDIEGGCVGCHRTGPRRFERGAGHAFVAPASQCRDCHEESTDLTALRLGLGERAESLLAQLRVARALAPAPDDPNRPPHARGLVITDPGAPLGRAAANVLLVVEDRGAAAHNPTYARMLLDAAEEALGQAR